MSVPNSLVSERVFAQLLESLLSGAYEPGEALPKQRALAADLGVTLSSLREALKRLEQMGLIDVRHGDASYVRDWRTHGGLDVLAHLLLRGGGLDGAVLRDVLEARALMLRELAALAAERRRASHASRLQELARTFAEIPDDAPDEVAAHVDFAFFTEVAEAAGNLVFVLILNAIRSLYFDHLAALPVTARPSGLAGHYTALATAIEEEDVERARGVAFELATLQRRRVEELLP
ncbi:FadR/GntR family transcriptional regulator [Paraconexibacter sp.]|uniref:FadR/GntR family transcriptional regulator n=1 Tax=Paraconexibacter sp. TaxID=2949640 RepID=UPI0035645609